MYNGMKKVIKASHGPDLRETSGDKSDNGLAHIGRFLRVAGRLCVMPERPTCAEIIGADDCHKPCGSSPGEAAV